MDVGARNLLIPHASFALSRTCLSLLTLLAAHLTPETCWLLLRSFARKLYSFRKWSLTTTFLWIDANVVRAFTESSLPIRSVTSLRYKRYKRYNVFL